MSSNVSNRNQQRARKGPPNVKKSAGVRNAQRKKKQQQGKALQKQATSQDKFLHAAGQRGTDIRAPQQQTSTSVQKSLVVTGYNNTLPVTADVLDRTVSYISMGIVLAALKNGYSWKLATTGISPYGAFLRIIKVLKSAMDGAAPLVTNAPKWFWNLMSAIKPKLVPFKTGSIRYDWHFSDSGLGDEVVFTLSAGDTTDYSVYWGVAGLSDIDVNGFYILTPPPDVSEAAQIESLQDLFGWFNGRTPLVEGPEAWMQSDTSAFAACYPELGTSFFSPGAIKTTTYSERQVDCPILAKLAVYQPFSEAQYRGWQKGGVSAGSACYIGARIPELHTLDDWRNKTSPTFKFYNFDEFFEVLSFTLGLALENFAANVGQTVTPCPLTSQEVQLVLRQSMIPFFNNEMAQDLRYEGNWEEFLPFVVGPNGVASGQYSIQLPMLLAENIKCVTRITAALKSRFGGKRQIQDLVPVLGRFSDRPQLGNYFWGTDATPVYRTDPDEVPIRLVDASAVVGQNTYYLDLNGKSMAVLVAQWNDWINKYSNVLSGLVSLTPGPGCYALMTNVYTNLQISVVQPGVVVESTDPVGKKKEQKKTKRYGKSPPTLGTSTVGAVNGSSYFHLIGDIRLTAQLGIYEAIAPYIKIFVLPVNKSATQETPQTSFQSLQVWQVEPGFINRSSALGEQISPETFSTVLTAEARHRQMAAADVKALISDGDNELIAGLKEMSKHGEGGFFTAIADMIGGVTGLPLGGIARAIEGSQ